MALDDKDIFNAIFSRFNDQPIEFIMDQYEKAKKLNGDIEKRQTAQTALTGTALDADDMPVPFNTKAEAAPKKKYTKRSLVIKPEEAITDTYIKCCICGDSRSSLTTKHLATHGISVEEYKKLCSYPATQNLMAKNHAKKVRENVAKAQKARMEKKSQSKAAGKKGS